jgi:CHAD domain-containing protein
MAYRVDEGEALPKGVRRIASEEFDLAIEALGVAPQKRADGVHAARKHFKKLRALLALVEGELGRSEVDYQDTSVRDAGRAVASARDAEVVVQALDLLKKRFGSELTGTAFDGVRRRLVRERREARKKLAASDSIVADVISRLAEARSRVDEWDLDRDSFGAIRAGLRLAYARGRSTRRKLCDDPTTEQFHSWRKYVKTLWYYLRLLESVWPPMMRRHADQLEKLADALGGDHDLAVLRAVALERAIDGTGALIALLDQRRAELQVEALQCGALLYAERPRAFTSRIERYWKATRSKPKVDERDLSEWRAQATAADAGA